MDCTCAILSVCVLVNIFLIVLVAFQEDRYVEENHRTSSTYNLEPFSEQLERFKDKIDSLDDGIQRLINHISDSNEYLKRVNSRLSNHQIDSKVKLIAIKQRLLGVKTKVDQLKNNLGEVTSVVDGIKRDFNGIELSQSKLESYQDLLHSSEQISDSSYARNDQLLFDYYDYELHDKLNHFLVNFGPLFGQFIQEDLSSDYQYSDDEDSDSNEAMSPLKKFKLFNEKVNWTKAGTECHAKGMRLVSITSPAEQEEIVELIKKADLGSADFWTSGNDWDSGIFVWDTTGTMVTYSNWIPGEPKNSLIADLQEEKHCIMLVYDFDYRWNISGCSERKYFVCEE